MNDPIVTLDEASAATDREPMPSPVDPASVAAWGYSPEPVTLDVKAIDADVAALIAELAAFSTATDRAIVDRMLDDEEAAFRSAATVRDVLAVPVSAVAEARANAERKLKDARQADARRLRHESDTLDTLLTAALDSTQILASEVGRATPANRLLARVVDCLATQEARTRIAGMTARELADAYRTTPDSAAPEFVRLVEQEAIAGFRTVQLRDSDPRRDLPALEALRRDIRTRREARVPAPLRAAAERLRATRASAVTDAMLRLVESGKWRA